MKNLRLFSTLFILSAGCFFTTESKAQRAQMSNGEHLLNAGLGVATHYDGGIPVSLSYERQAIAPNLTIGGVLGYMSHSYSTLNLNYQYSVFLFGARASFHFNELLSKAANMDVENLDLYAGGGLAYQSISWNTNFAHLGASSNFDSRLRPLFHIGSRYYFTDHVGAFLELGDIGLSTLHIGVAFKF